MAQNPAHEPLSRNDREYELYAQSRLGILGVSSSDKAPGTVLLTTTPSDQEIPSSPHRPIELVDRSLTRVSAKTATSRFRAENRSRKTADGRYILVPQPSDSPDNPLNWTEKSRRVILIALGCCSMLVGMTITALAPGFKDLAKDLEVSYSAAVRTTGFYLLGLGLGCVAVFPTAKVFGKRPILSALAFILYTMWCALSSGYVSLSIARVFQGIAASPMEILTIETISEISFLHQRGLWIGTYALFLMGGMNFMPIISGIVMHYRTWHLCFWIISVLAGVVLVLLAVFVPDMLSDRLAQSQYEGAQRETEIRDSGQSTSKSAGRRKSAAGYPPDGLSGQVDGPARAKPQLRLSNLPQALEATNMPKSDSEAKYSEDDPTLPTLHNLNSPYYVELERSNDYLSFAAGPATSGNGPKNTTINSVLANTGVSQRVEPSTSAQRKARKAISRQNCGETSKQSTKVLTTNRSLGSLPTSRRLSYRS